MNDRLSAPPVLHQSQQEVSNVPCTPEAVLDTKEAAAFLKIHPKTLQRMARQGRIPAYRIGDLWRFRLSVLNVWLASTVLSSSRHSCRE